MDDPLEQFEAGLGYRFRDRQLLVLALTHPSFAAETEPPVPDNQRLEFLGDSVLHFLTAELVYEHFPDLPEGKLTRIRSVFTKQETLADLARQLGVGEHLRLGRGEDRAGGRERPSNLGDAFEALLAAVFLDGGVAPVRTLCRRLLVDRLTLPDELLAWENPKGALQELTQSRFQSTPVYELVRVSGPEHLPDFEVRVLVAGEDLGSGRAGNRKTAEMRAAETALRKLQDDAKPA